MSRIQKIARIAMALGLLAALGLVAACAAPTTAPQSGGASNPDDTSVVAPTIKLVEPAASAEVAAGDVKVAVETTGLKFVMPSNTLVAGEGHVHFTIDDGPEVMSTDPSMVLKDVAPGPHKLKAELVQNDTKPFDPPIKQEIDFTVK